MSGYAHTESLVSTHWVADHLSDPTVRFVEAIWGDGEYRSGHVPGAVAWDFAADLQDPAHNDIIDQARLEALLTRSGVIPATTVVVYSGLSNPAGDIRLLAAQSLRPSGCTPADAAAEHHGAGANVAGVARESASPVGDADDGEHRCCFTCLNRR